VFSKELPESNNLWKQVNFCKAPLLIKKNCKPSV
jgi:hypothetical protein